MRKYKEGYSVSGGGMCITWKDDILYEKNVEINSHDNKSYNIYCTDWTIRD